MKVKKINLIIHPLFVLFAVYFCTFYNFFCFISFCVALICHEYAHYFVAKKYGFVINNFKLMPYGVQLNLKNKVMSAKQEFLVSSAGPIFNLILIIVCAGIWWLFPEIYNYTYFFAMCNFFLAVYNLLPLLPFDGSKIMLSIAGKFNKRIYCYKWLKILNYIVAISLVVLGVLSIAFSQFNFYYFVLAFFIFCGAFLDDDSAFYENIFAFFGKRAEFPQKVVYYKVNENFELRKIYSLLNSNYFLVLLVEKNGKIVKVVSQNEFKNIGNNINEKDI